MKFAGGFVVFCLFLSAEVSAKLIRIPLRRVISLREKLLAEGSWAAHCKQKYAKIQLRPKVLQSWLSQQGGNLQFDPDSYLADISIGNPPQHFRVIPDTGSADFWVVTKFCRGTTAISPQLDCGGIFCNSSATSGCNPLCDAHLFGNLTTAQCQFDPCAGKRKFDGQMSSTYSGVGEAFEVQFNSGSVRGGTGLDSLRFAGVEVPRQHFGEANDLGDSFNCQQFEGILGLGYPRLSRNFRTSLLASLIDSKLLSRPIFAFHIDPDAKRDETGGEIHIGGVDTTKFRGEIHWQPVTVQRYWQLKMDGLRVGPLRIAPANGYRIVVDSGTPFLGGPAAVINLIAKAVGAVYSSPEQTYFVNCTDYQQLPFISLEFGGREFPIGPLSYVLKVAQLCTLNIQTFGSGGAGIHWILGNVFTRSFYTIYDFGQHQVGFALSV